MEKIYSKLEPTKLLHFIRRKDEALSRREDLVEPENFIQCSQLKLNAGQTFKPHKHIWKSRTMDVIAQESWIVIQGSVECHFYDLDDALLEKVILNAGDASFTLEGGHNYLILEDNTIVYEYKTGPYEGQHLDKEFIQ
jgi:cupin fold WbuC family metalloprotein